MHGSIGKTPEWVRFIGQKVGCRQGFFTRCDGLSAERTVCLPRLDPIHSEFGTVRQPLPDGPRISCGDCSNTYYLTFL